MKSLVAALCLFLLLAVRAVPAADAPSAGLLDFEAGPRAGTPSGWGGGPPGTLFADSLTVHGGHWSCRLERGPEAGNSFSVLTRQLEQDRQGKTITLRGFLRTEAVDGWAGLWLRLDGDQGIVEFDNMQQRNLSGTADWKEYSITLPLNPEARRIFFGTILAGQGTAWVDDLQLLVDGKPWNQAPVLVRELTVFDEDREFAAGSGVEIDSLTEVQVKNLALLGKVWGFLKYHHPAVTGGHRHWDFELFRVLPQVLAAADRKQAVGVILTWFGGLADVPGCDPCARLGADPAMVPRLDWLKDEELLGRTLSRRLLEVYRNRPAAEEQFYLTLHPMVGNPVFRHEPAYMGLGFPDAGYRLLALFRYWNIIEYWYPNRDLIDRNWDEVLAVYLPEVTLSADEAAYRLAFLRLIAEVKDGHAGLHSADRIRPPAGDSTLPVVFRFLGEQAVVAGYADPEKGPATGLRPGDEILGIDGRPVAELVRSWEPFYPASNSSSRLARMARNLARGPAGPCTLEIRRDGEPVKITARRSSSGQGEGLIGRTHDLPGDTFRLLGPEVAYLKLSSVVLEEVDDYVAKAAGTRGLIIDIRNYPSAFLVFALGSHLVTEATPFASFTRADPENPGAFIWGQTLSLFPQEPHYGGRVVILVDEVSISQSEYTAMAFRAAPGAIVVGSTTAGADGNISNISLPGNLHTNISGIGVYYPDRQPTQRVGIVPDVTVVPTCEGIRQGRDEVLEEALRRILGHGVPDAEIQALYHQP